MSKRGFAGVREAVQEREAKMSSGGGGGTNWFKLKNSGDKAVVRFLEEGDDVHWVYAHELPPEGNQKWGKNTPCLDQDGDGAPCPGCEAGLKRKFQGYINLIWRGAPQWKRNAEGFFEKDAAGNLVPDGTADQPAVWNAGITVFEELDGKDATYKGLTSRDFTVTRKGTGLKTRYTVEPTDPDAGKTELSERDEEIVLNKADINELTKSLEYDEFKKKLMGGGSAPTPDDDYDDPSDRDNPFLRRS